MHRGSVDEVGDGRVRNELPVNRAVLALLGIVVGCSPTATPGEPCGRNPVWCVEQNDAGQLVPTGACCWSGEICGGHFPNVGCPVGSCCASETQHPWSAR